MARDFGKVKGSGVVMTKAQNYAQWQLAAVSDLHGMRVLEVGAGVGNLTLLLAKQITEVVAIEPNPEACTIASGKLKTLDNVTTLCSDLMSFDAGGQDFDLIIMTNVLEHIEDEHQALQRVKGLLSAQGLLFILVPAHQWLFGTLDAEVGHFRRYTKNSLDAVLRVNGLQPLFVRYMNSVGAIGWFVNYCLLRRRRTNTEDSSFQVSFFDKFMVGPLRWLEERIEPVVGLSTYSLAKMHPPSGHQQ